MFKRFKGSGTSRAIGAGAQLAMYAYISRALPEEHAGIMFYAITAVMLGALIGRMGLDNIAPRNFSKEFQANEFNSVFLGLVSFIKTTALSATLACIVVTVALAYFGSIGIHTRDFAIAASAIFFYSIIWIHSGFYKAIGAPGKAGLVEAAALPLLFILFCLITEIFTGQLLIIHAAICYTGAAATTLAVSSITLHSELRGSHTFKLFRTAPIVNVTKENLGALISFSTLSYLLTWYPSFYLMRTTSPENVALFNTAQRTAMLISFILVIVNSVVVRDIALIARDKDYTKLRNMWGKTSLAMATIATPIYFLAISSDTWYGFIFGQPYIASFELFIIFGAAQLINVSTGPVVYVLICLNREWALAAHAIATLAISTPLTIGLTKIWETKGAALSSALTVSFINIALAVYTYRTLSQAKNV